MYCAQPVYWVVWFPEESILIHGVMMEVHGAYTCIGRCLSEIKFGKPDPIFSSKELGN